MIWVKIRPTYLEAWPCVQALRLGSVLLQNYFVDADERIKNRNGSGFPACKRA
jgi:hypothetical protein